ncbi:MAG: GNAT family N-acetyltransferase [Endomicrobium sp.]|jgi:RimJ/RimL family protein N-acetyltransferase|nr:GNAT family N-acetyltransferase [Endomicrobium sp.]
MNTLEKEDVKSFISLLGELQDEKVRLCNYYTDHKLQAILAKHYIEFDEESFNFFFSGANLNSMEDFLIYQKSFEKNENYRVFIIKDLENNPVGQIGMEYWAPLGGINVSYAIAKQYWGNGYALDAVKTIMKQFYES